MRFYLYAVAAYMAVVMAASLIALSDVVFGGSKLGTFARRVGLAVVWPLAVLTSAGRKFLFNTGRNDHANSGGVSGDSGAGAGPSP